MSRLLGVIQGEIISRPTWPPPGGVPTITGPHSPGVVVALVVVDELVVGTVGVAALVDEEVFVSLPLAAQAAEAPVVVPAGTVEPVGEVVVVVVVSVAVPAGGVGVAPGAVLVLVLELGLELELVELDVELAPAVDGLLRFG
jgi:hypothetical protein